MKKITRTQFKSFDGKFYDDENACRLADSREMLRRFGEEEWYYNMTRRSLGELLYSHRDTLIRCLNGEPVYQTDEELIKRGIK